MPRPCAALDPRRHDSEAFQALPQPFNLTDQQIASFRSDGVLKIDQLLPPAGVTAARQAVLRPLEAMGLWCDGDWRLDHIERPLWPATGLKPSRDIGNRHPEVEALIDEPGVRMVVEQLGGGGPFDRKVYPRPQILASLPNAGPWVLPNGWHVDAPRLASGNSPGLQMFACLDDVAPRGGATLAVAGSHHLLNDGRHLKARGINATLRQEPFFQRLFYGPADADLPAGRSGASPLQVVEFSGRAGDVWLMDLRVLHAAAPNASDRPRLMMTHRFVPTARLPEIAEAFGWPPSLP